jgi:hypothetical protein
MHHIRMNIHRLHKLTDVYGYGYVDAVAKAAMF